MALLGAAIALFAYTKIIEKPSGDSYQRIVQVLKSRNAEAFLTSLSDAGGTD